MARTRMGLRPALFVGLLATLGALGAGGAAGCRRPYGGGENNPAACGNQVDDDFDGYADCADLDCSPFCGGPSDSGLPGSDGGTGGVCGDGACDMGEGCVTCEADCGACPPGCGDGTCAAATEDCSSCSLDCGSCPAVCGDGACDPIEEDCAGCPSDCGICPPGCPDGTCSGGETCSSCPADCGSCCGNGVCSGGETCTTCASDCGSCCGNGVCSTGETCSTCPSDCGACCGNGVCSGGETCTSCPSDCGTCAPVCGNGLCTGTETCSSCPSDCGACGGCGDGACSLGETCSTCPSDCGIFGTSMGLDTQYELCEVTTGASTCPDVIGGTSVAMSDDTYTSIPIGFSFPFYGGTYTSVYVTSNGRLNFVTADSSYSNACLSSTSPASDVFAFWDDLTDSSGGITYALTDVTPNRVLEVKWNIPHLSQPDNVDVRVLLYETTGLLTVCYVDTTSGTYTSGSSATTGIHGSGTDYIQNSCNGTISAGTIAYYMPY